MFTPFTVTGCSLELLRIGERGIVTFCKVKDEIIRKKLMAIGVNIGTTITVEQCLPCLIIKVGNTSSTIDKETARAIYVRVINN